MSDNNNNEKIVFQKTWDKEDYVKEKFKNRPIYFYINKTELFLNICLYFSIASLCFALLNTYKVINLPNKTSYYISSLNGKLYSNNLTQSKKEDLIKAITTIKQKQNQQSQNKK